jgi:hypothetical protein
MNIQELEEYFKQLGQNISLLKSKPSEKHNLKIKQAEYDLIKKHIDEIYELKIDIERHNIQIIENLSKIKKEIYIHK